VCFDSVRIKKGCGVAAMQARVVNGDRRADKRGQAVSRKGEAGGWRGLSTCGSALGYNGPRWVQALGRERRPLGHGLGSGAGCCAHRKEKERGDQAGPVLPPG